jgi:hypothetical protein
VTKEDDEQAVANERLVAALKKLDVLSRIDNDGRVLATDGLKEYEVTVDLTRLLSRSTGSRSISVGKSSLDRLERGDVTSLLFGAVASTAGDQPISPHYAPLEWDRDTDYLDGDDCIEAQGDDWRYTISPVRGNNDEVIGFQVSGGDYETGDEFGSSLIGGRVGEPTLIKAKAAAAEDYASRYREAEQFLDDLLDDWDDDDDRPRTRRNDRGRIVCRVDEPGIEEVEVVATLRDYDGYNPGGRSVALSLRAILRYSYNGDRDGLLDELRRLIRIETRSDGS